MKWEKEWDGSISFLHDESKLKSCYDLFEKNINLKVCSLYTNTAGRYIILGLSSNPRRKVCLINLCGPDQ